MARSTSHEPLDGTAPAPEDCAVPGENRRERVVVALPGSPEGEALIRRGARIAARSAGAELLVVHVAGAEGRREPHPAALAAHRALTERLGGTYQQLVGDDIASALADFARRSDATQLVLGASRRSRLVALLTGPGIGATVVREAGDLDVHVVTHDAAGTHQLVLPRATGALSVRRRAAGFVLALLLGPALTALLWSGRTPAALTTDALALQLLVVVVALVGGMWPALFAAVLSGLTLDYLFVPPYGTITIAQPADVLALLLYVMSAALVSFVVDQAARRTRAARRADAESEVLALVAGSVIGGRDAIAALLSRAREAFGATAVRLVDRDGGELAAEGHPSSGARTTVQQVGDRAVLELSGSEVAAANRRLLTVIANQLDAALEHRELADSAEQLGPLAETDRVRTALLAALGHDLRRPLAAATAAVTSLGTPDLPLSPVDREALLITARSSLENLNTLVTNLLDVSRVQAGVLAVNLVDVEVDDLLPSVLEELHVTPGAVVLDLQDPAPPLRADPVLLQRVLVNLLANALRYSSTPPTLQVGRFGSVVRIRVVDTGPGVTDERKEAIFQPFQREGDVDNSAGIGLGLALSRGFVEGMGGTLTAEDTPGGGLSMSVSLAAAPSVATGGAVRLEAGRT